MVVAPHREGGQAQYVEAPIPEPGTADPLGPALTWAVRNLDRPLSVGELASRAAVSERTFMRRFRAAHGTSPHRWLVHQRVLRARRLLETSAATVEQVADACGFGAAATLRHEFRRLVGTSPTAYRRQFARAESFPVGGGPFRGPKVRPEAG
jgi:transcriptional regulator GlxA family with amidase domain